MPSGHTSALFLGGPPVLSCATTAVCCTCVPVRDKREGEKKKNLPPSRICAHPLSSSSNREWRREGVVCRRTWEKSERGRASLHSAVTRWTSYRSRVARLFFVLFLLQFQNRRHSLSNKNKHLTFRFRDLNDFCFRAVCGNVSFCWHSNDSGGHRDCRLLLINLPCLPYTIGLLVTDQLPILFLFFFFWFCFDCVWLTQLSGEIEEIVQPVFPSPAVILCGFLFFFLNFRASDFVCCHSTNRSRRKNCRYCL